MQVRVDRVGVVSVTGRKSERTYSPEQTRDRLMQAALELFSTKSFRGTSVQEVVAAAGVTKGAFYHHFSSKEKVLALIHDEFLVRTQANQQRILETYPTAVEQLAHMVFDLVMVTLQHQRHVTIFFREWPEVSVAQRAEIAARRDRPQKIYLDVVTRGIARGEFRADLDPDVAVFGIIGMCVWSYQWYQPGGRLSMEQIARQFTTMALASVEVDAQDVLPEGIDISSNRQPLPMLRAVTWPPEH